VIAVDLPGELALEVRHLRAHASDIVLGAGELIEKMLDLHERLAERLRPIGRNLACFNGLQVASLFCQALTPRP
jgi:hypothetical protein